MLLKQIVLQNIRSYEKCVIDFPEGSILLSGDIGAGKSSLLLAIEFALFGASRPDLPTEALLRKGAVNGAVELSFFLDGKEILIKRNLKKEGETIKQTSGYIVINNVKKELTPVEMKAEMIRLLGYPEEILSKNKNYIFRFTVYTPQEDMKYILQENADVRLDVLRKIFNIDKYKNIRENLQIYLKEMRGTFFVLENKVEPLDRKKLELYELQNEEGDLRIMWEGQEFLRQELKQKISKAKNDLELNEMEQQIFIDIKRKVSVLKNFLEEKNKLLQQSVVKEEDIYKQLNSMILPENLNLELLNKEIDILEISKNRLMQNKVIIGEQIKNVQKNIDNLQKSIKSRNESTALLENKEKLVEMLNKDISLKMELREKKEQLDYLLEQIIEVIAKNRALLQQVREVKDKIGNLHQCPTCLQVISDHYKNQLEVQETEKIKGAENLLQELTSKKAEIIKQREEILSKIEQVLSKENLLVKTKAELEYLVEIKLKLSEEQEKLKQTVQENNNLMQQLVALDKEETIEALQAKINNLQKLVQDNLKKQYLQKSYQELKEQERILKEQIEAAEKNLFSEEEKLKGEEDIIDKYKKSKQILQELLDKDKELAVQLGIITAKIENLRKQTDMLRKDVDKLILEKERLIKTKELYNWMEDYFLPLCHTIEKQVMISVHSMFNQLFQEWFSLLIDDENVFARIDDSFTPVIEQNGYEIIFGNLSGGEKTSAALAYRLALNRVINDIIHEIRTKELLILDEPTDGFSSEQLDKVRDVLGKMPLRQTIIVSHESKIESFVDNVIRIGKNGHVSEIIS